MKTQTEWHHAPPHIFLPGMIYMVTGGTANKNHFFKGNERLEYLQGQLLTTLARYGWIIQAWAVFVNHYHFVARAPEALVVTLGEILQELHSVTAKEINRLDQVCGREVWFQFWDTCLTFEKSWLARLNYVHNNAAHHRLVQAAANYPFCSAVWFEQIASPGFRRKVQSFKYDKLKNIVDDF